MVKSTRTPPPPLPVAIEAYRGTLLAKSQHAARNFGVPLKRLLAFLPTLGLDPATATTDALPEEVLSELYVWLLKEMGRAHRRTAAQYVAQLRPFFRFLDRRRWLHPDVTYVAMGDGLRELVGTIPRRAPKVDPQTALVVSACLAAPLPPPEPRAVYLTALRDRALLATLYATGARRAEVARLNRADVADGHAADALIVGKGDKERALFFDEPALAAIRAYVAARQDTALPLFLRHDDGRGQPGPRGEHWRISPQTCWLVVKKWAAVAGVVTTTHHLRHLKARTLLHNGAQLAEISDLLGHSSVEITKAIYAPYTREHLRTVFDKFSVPADELARRAAGGP